MYSIHGAEHIVGHLKVNLTCLTPRTTPHTHRTNAIAFYGLAILSNDGLKRLIPADALPAVAPTILPGALHRVEQAVFVVVVLLSRQTAHTQAALAYGMLLVALHFHQLPVLYVHLKPTAQVVTPDTCRARPIHARAILKHCYSRRSVLAKMQCRHDVLLIVAFPQPPGAETPSDTDFTQPDTSLPPRHEG